MLFYNSLRKGAGMKRKFPSNGLKKELHNYLHHVIILIVAQTGGKKTSTEELTKRSDGVKIKWCLELEP